MLNVKLGEYIQLNYLSVKRLWSCLAETNAICGKPVQIFGLFCNKLKQQTVIICMTTRGHLSGKNAEIEKMVSGKGVFFFSPSNAVSAQTEHYGE